MDSIVLQLPSWTVNLIGSVAAICTTISFVPQLIRIYRLKSADEISLVMFLVFSLGVFLWLLYGIFIRSFPVILANSFTLALSLAILVLKIRYDRKRGRTPLLRK
jgi:MtN3 and saliva related transmembrane protein